MVAPTGLTPVFSGFDCFYQVLASTSGSGKVPVPVKFGSTCQSGLVFSHAAFVLPAFLFAVLDALIDLFFRSDISAETLWVGGWLLRQLLPYSVEDSSRYHPELLKVRWPVILMLYFVSRDCHSQILGYLICSFFHSMFTPFDACICGYGSGDMNTSFLKSWTLHLIYIRASIINLFGKKVDSMPVTLAFQCKLLFFCSLELSNFNGTLLFTFLLDSMTHMRSWRTLWMS